MVCGLGKGAIVDRGGQAFMGFLPDSPAVDVDGLQLPPVARWGVGATGGVIAWPTPAAMAARSVEGAAVSRGSLMASLAFRPIVASAGEERGLNGLLFCEKLAASVETGDPAGQGLITQPLERNAQPPRDDP